MKIDIPRKAGFKVVKRRDYSDGSIRDRIAAAQSLPELEEVRREVVALLKAGRISSGTKRKLEKAGAVRYRELEHRVIVTPQAGGGRRTKAGLYLP